MRKFWITSENDPNMKIDLMDKDTYGSNPSGLGLSMSTSTYLAGQDNVPYNYQYTYSDISYTLILGAISDEPYRVYREVVDKLSYNDLLLHYVTDETSEEYVRKVSFSSIEKSQIDYSLGVLGAPLTLTPLTPWYKWTDNRKAITQQFYDNNLTKLKKIISEGVSLITTRERLICLDNTECVHLSPDVEVPVKLRYKINSPGLLSFKMVLYDSKLNQSQLCEFEYDLQQNDIIDFSSDYLDPHCYLIRESQTIDITGYMTTKSDGFIRIPAREIVYLYIDTKQNWSNSAATVQTRIEKVLV